MAGFRFLMVARSTLYNLKSRTQYSDEVAVF